MGDRFPYTVFFECPGVDEEQRRKIEKYFQIRRKSGGGDCGSLTNLHDNVYSIAFRERDAQQRVLQKSEHELECAGGRLVVTVRDSPGPSSKSNCPKLDITSSKREQRSLSLPARDEEYELQLDCHLLRYLKECPGAAMKLKKDLACLACFAELYPEEERALVRSSGQAEGQNWKAKVDILFGGYMCHYEVDPHKGKALLQADSSQQTVDEVMVFSEASLVIVVGESFQVKNRLKEVENSVVRRRTTSSEKQTITLRIGEPKLHLIWNDIESSLPKDFPGVKVMKGDSGCLVLEGSVEEIWKARTWISDKEKLVLARKVADASPHFLTFLRKAYGGPGALSGFLGVGDKVEIELRDTELCFFSLCAHALVDAEKLLHDKVKEVKIDIPNFSSVPSELRENLKIKVNELNQGKCRAQAVFGQKSMVSLLGHTKEVEELNEVVVQFILDKTSTEGNVILPFPELVNDLPEFLRQHGLSWSEVKLNTLNVSGKAMVSLQGPSSKVTEVRNQLGPFLDSLVKEIITIELPGAGKYFTSQSGKEKILSVARSQKCLIEQPLGTTQSLGSSTFKIAGYRLGEGLQVLVCHGDITKLEADALVNAANSDLEHHGGIAAALSKAGGPQVQKESRALVKCKGKIAPGEVVMTTGGDLNCRKLLHAVGPKAGTDSGREQLLLVKAVQSALNLADSMALQSIAFPCISSGLFGVPVTLCSDAIVTAVKRFGSQEGRSLNTIILIDNRIEAVKAMQDACDRELQRITPTNRTRDLGYWAGADVSARGAEAPGDGIRVELIQGTIETQQVDSLISPMAGHDPLSTRVGHVLSSVVGPQLNVKFHVEADGATLPGNSVLVKSLPSLQCKGVFFLNLIPWDKSQDGTAVQVLRQGIRKILTSCIINGFTSVALPVLGTGSVLSFPHNVVAKALLEEVCVFEQSQSSNTSFLVRIVVYPGDKKSSKAFQSAQEALCYKRFTNMCSPNQATFYRHVSDTNVEVTATLGGVTLQLAHGDIIRETTDVIVNTTDFSKNDTGVTKAILTAAGPSIKADLAKVGTPPDNMCTTGPGLLGCKEIIHAAFKGSPDVILEKCKKILKQCESKGYSSVAFPAINTGAAGLDATVACKAMLDGMTLAITDLTPKSLSVIRIVFMQPHVFQAFRTELETRFGKKAIRHLTMKDKALKILKKLSRTSTTSKPQGKTFTSFKPLPIELIVITCDPGTTRMIKTTLERILLDQIVEREVQECKFARLSDMEQEAIQAKVEPFDISVERRSKHISDGNRAARDQLESGGGVYVLKGLKEDVLSVTELVNKAIENALAQDLQDKEEAMLALNVQWLIKNAAEVWQELSLHENYMLEMAHLKGTVFAYITIPDGLTVSVNLRQREATDQKTGKMYKVKRNETHGTTIELPTNWDAMEGEAYKFVELQSDSLEYKNVAQNFHKTANHTIVKIERVQNVHLWQAFSVCRQRILSKNGAAELGEKVLYHGTSAGSCICIARDRFDRGYAGTHAAIYGKGVYFAVEAKYSAQRYSPPDTSGLKRLYAVQVLTGRYTPGKSDMTVPPPRGSDPTDRYDSVVDKEPPSMFIIFHDDQAYPEYLITFK